MVNKYLYNEGVKWFLVDAPLEIGRASGYATTDGAGC